MKKFILITLLFSGIYCSYPSCTGFSMGGEQWWINYFNSSREMRWFHHWAFGVSADTECSNMFRLHSWNHLHGYKYTLKPYFPVKKTLPILIQLWKSETDMRMHNLYFKRIAKSGS